MTWMNKHTAIDTEKVKNRKNLLAVHLAFIFRLYDGGQ